MRRAVRVVVGAALTAAAIWFADPAAVGRAAARADPWWIAAAILLVLPDRALMAHRWILLLRPARATASVPVGSVLRVFFVSTFLGTFLPSVGGDAVRAFGLARHDVSLADAAASVLMDRLLGIWSLLVLSTAALWIAGAAVSPAAAVTACALGATVVGVVGLASERAAALGRRALASVPVRAVRRALLRLFESTRAYRAWPRTVGAVAVESLAVQVLRVVQAVCLGRALAIDAPVAAYFVVVPVALLVMLLPVTVYGLGTSQVAFVWLFDPMGVPAAEAVALSVLFVALGAVGNLPGGLLYAFAGGGRREAVERSRPL
jgi:uncharacterized protein (TIRG00374 family)